MSISKLAILGGEPIQKTPFIFNNSIGIEEKMAVQSVLESGELSGFVASPNDAFYGGAKVRELQHLMEEFLGVKNAIAVNSATSGLHAAVYAAKVGPGDEVITAPYTMSATSTAILMCNGTPIFADIETETFGLDPKSVEACITEQTKAIITVNIFGHPSRLSELKKIAAENNLILIEDNSQSPGAKHFSDYTGTVGDIGVFSFNRHKVMQSGEGGVVVTDDDDLAQRMSLFRNHGECVVEAMNVRDIRNTAGLNLRMTEMEAAVAVEQFKKLPSMNAERQLLAARLTEGLSGIDAIKSPIIAENNDHVFYMYAMKFDETAAGISRDTFVKAMLAEGLFIRGGYVKPTYLEPLYQYKICFGDTNYPFSANPRNQQIEYKSGLCPKCEDIQNNQLLITAIMQPPQTLDYMDSFSAACVKNLRQCVKT